MSSKAIELKEDKCWGIFRNGNIKLTAIKSKVSSAYVQGRGYIYIYVKIYVCNM